MADSGAGKIIRGTVRALFTLLGGVAGYQSALFVINENWLPQITQVHPIGWVAICAALFALSGFILAPLFWLGVGKIGRLFELQLQSVSMPALAVAIFGLILGLVVANLIAIPLRSIPAVGVYISVLLNVALASIGVTFSLRRREEVWAVLGGLKGRLLFKRKKTGDAEIAPDEDFEGYQEYQDRPKILDTSVIIDGRVLDVASTGFLEGLIVLPRFVLSELQAVADSSDPVRRTRGRRGLDVVNELQNIKTLKVEIHEASMKSLGRELVDEALVVLAKKIGGKVLTTDYNLNKIAQIEGVNVLNVNDLANALKPMLLPGEVVLVDVIREGKEQQQGVGYLDDGTMIVVEDGEKHIGRRVYVTVTSMLQTSAGRMVFGRVKR